MNEAKIKEIIEEITEKTTFNVEEICVSYDEEHNQFWCKVVTNEPQFFIGRTGENLMALNHIVRKIITKKLRSESPQAARPSERDKLGEAGETDQPKTEINIVIDVNDYQKKKIENLKTMAHMMAERARFFKRNVEVDPMSSYDRRIIHEFLTDAPGVETESTGEGRDRRIVIKFVPNKEQI